MHHSSKWKSALATGLVVALGGLANLGCDAVNCGDGTIEQNGSCVPADDNPGSAQCGPGTVLGANGKCEPELVVVCDEGTTMEQVDPDTGVVTCVGTGTGGDCGTPIQCPAPSAGKITICGQLYDTETNAPIAEMNATGAPCSAVTADGPCSLKVQFFDALEFAMGPTTAVPKDPAGGLVVDTCGRFRGADLPEASFGFMGVAVDDANGQPDDHKLTGVALANGDALPARGFHVYVTRKETDDAWTTSSAIGGQSFSARGVLALIFLHGDSPWNPISGVQIRRGTNPITNNDYYFTDAVATTRSTVDPATGRSTTGANGTGLVTGFPSPDNYTGAGGEPAGCQWPQNLAGAIPGVVFVQHKDAVTPGGAECP
ncbi:MAG: hypothetical protein JNK64_40040 [Myxococcales bacterium]|nr:hypothetical protein [Myxococcales bacterium]